MTEERYGEVVPLSVPLAKVLEQAQDAWAESERRRNNVGKQST